MAQIYFIGLFWLQGAGKEVVGSQNLVGYMPIVVGYVGYYQFLKDGGANKKLSTEMYRWR